MKFTEDDMDWQEAFERLRVEHDATKAALLQAQNAAIDLTGKLSGVQSALDDSHSELMRVRELHKTALEAVEAMRQNLVAAQGSLDFVTDENRAQATVIKDLEASNTDLIFERNDAVRRLEQCEKDLADDDVTIDKAADRIAALESRLDRIKHEHKAALGFLRGIMDAPSEGDETEVVARAIQWLEAGAGAIEGRRFFDRDCCEWHKAGGDLEYPCNPSVSERLESK